MMKKMTLFGTLIIGIGLTLTLLWILGSQSFSAKAASSTVKVEVLAAELHVCPSGCTYSSVQAAVDAANKGDVVKVAAGTYTGVNVRPRDDITTTGVVTQVVYISKSVTVQGGYTTTNWDIPSPLSQPTTLDAEGEGRVLYITGDISPTIAGLSITGGDATGMGGHVGRFGSGELDGGGGIYVISATVTILDNQVFNNNSDGNVGGVHLYRSNAAINGNSITDNHGSGLLLYWSDADISGNTLTANRDAGIELLVGDSAISDNIIAGNDNGGVYLWVGSSTISGNTIFANSTPHGGGGVKLGPSSDAMLINNTIISNSAQTGGGVEVELDDNTNVELINNVIAENHASRLGSGLYIEDSSPRLLHNTIARNRGGEGIAIYVTADSEYSSTVALTNTILVSHSVGISVTNGNTVTVNGILWHNVPTTISLATGAIATLQNQHTDDPAFTADGYHLSSASAAIDKGVDAGTTVDIDGEPRPAGMGFDLGADEFWWRILSLPLVIRNYQP
jgi:hypothetical protein